MRQRHRQAYELLPAGSSVPRREPLTRVLALIGVLMLVSVGASWAAVVLMNDRPSSRAGSGSSGSAASTPPRTAPVPAQASDEPAERRTIAAAGGGTIPETLALPHENDADWAGANLKVPSCTPNQPEQQTMAQATDVRTIARDTGGELRTETLVIAPDESSASQIVDDFTSALTQCPAPTASTEPTYSSSQATVRPLPIETSQRRTGWDTSTIIASTAADSEGTVPGSATYALLARSGRAVVIATESGEDVAAPRRGVANAEVIARLQAVADELAPQLCQWRADRCTPPWFGSDGSPTFPAGTVQLPSGNLVFPDGTFVRPDGQVTTPDPDAVLPPAEPAPQDPDAIPAPAPTPGAGVGD